MSVASNDGSRLAVRGLRAGYHGFEVVQGSTSRPCPA